MTYVLTFNGRTYSVWRSNGTAIVYRDRCEKTARMVMRDLNRAVSHDRTHF